MPVGKKENILAGIPTAYIDLFIITKMISSTEMWKNGVPMGHFTAISITYTDMKPVSKKCGSPTGDWKPTTKCAKEENMALPARRIACRQRNEEFSFSVFITDTLW